jgi:hypothetical protein
LDWSSRNRPLLKKGTVHCHLGHPNYPGLLKVTVWIDMHDNRRADWNAAQWPSGWRTGLGAELRSACHEVASLYAPDNGRESAAHRPTRQLPAGTFTMRATDRSRNGPPG